MTIYELFLEFLKIYFWIFIIYAILSLLVSFSDVYKENKINAIKNGIYFKNNSNLFVLISWVLFFLSIKLT